jgi:putative flippase GtrA
MSELIKAAKFAVVGIGNTLIDYGVFALLAQLLSVNVFLSQVISYSCGILNSYIFNRSWTFQSQSRFFSPALVRFLVLNLCMLALSTGLLALFLQFGLSKLVAKGCTVVVTMAIGFVVNRLWVFRPNQQTKDA